MIKLDETEREDPTWIAWRAECATKQAEHDAAVLAYDPAKPKPNPKPKPSADLYAKLKEDHYAAAKAPFWGKCAYCELLIITGQPGDVEHFRPKGRVTSRETAKALRTRDDQREHPGYYWLAYDWKNLLLACNGCNRPHKRSADGRRIGKWDHFPLVDETQRAEAKGEEVHEQPLLINPLVEDPADHLSVDRTGVLRAVQGSARGKACIELFGLNERGLPDERKRAYDDAYQLFLDFFIARLEGNTNKAKRLIPRMNEIRQGTRPHLIATRQALSDARAKILELAAQPIH